MGAEKRRRFQPDPRTWLLLCLLGLAAILMIHSEIGCLCLFLACLLIHLLAGNGGKILPYGLYYLIFYGIGWLGVRLMDSGVVFSVSSMLSSLGIVSRVRGRCAAAESAQTTSKEVTTILRIILFSFYCFIFSLKLAQSM